MSREIRERGREIRETETMGMEMGYVLRSVLVCCCHLTHYPFVARLLICLAMFSSSADGVICDLCARQQNLNKSITWFLLRSAVCSLNTCSNIASAAAVCVEIYLSANGKLSSNMSNQHRVLSLEADQIEINQRQLEALMQTKILYGLIILVIDKGNLRFLLIKIDSQIGR